MNNEARPTNGRRNGDLAIAGRIPFGVTDEETSPKRITKAVDQSRLDATNVFYVMMT
jgi:hypothetical protein